MEAVWEGKAGRGTVEREAITQVDGGARFCGRPRRRASRNNIFFYLDLYYSRCLCPAACGAQVGRTHRPPSVADGFARWVPNVQRFGRSAVMGNGSWLSLQVSSVDPGSCFPLKGGPSCRQESFFLKDVGGSPGELSTVSKVHRPRPPACSSQERNATGPTCKPPFFISSSV
jgi:hypothetical protein